MFLCGHTFVLYMSEIVYCIQKSTHMALDMQKKRDGMNASLFCPIKVPSLGYAYYDTSIYDRPMHVRTLQVSALQVSVNQCGVEQVRSPQVCAPQVSTAQVGET